MSPFWRRILIAGAFAVGVAIVALLAIIAYALVSDAGGGPDAELARFTQTATASPTATATPRPTPSPVSPTVTPTPSPEPEQPTPIVTIVQEEAPPPVIEQPAPVQEAATPGPTEAERWEAVCSDMRAQAELHRIIWNVMNIMGTPSDDIKESMLAAEAGVREVCEGLGLTPVLTQNLAQMCSQAGQWRQLILDAIDAGSPREAALCQEQFENLGAFIEKYCQ